MDLLRSDIFYIVVVLFQVKKHLFKLIGFLAIATGGVYQILEGKHIVREIF